MADSDHIDVLLQALVFKMAGLIAEHSDVAKILTRIDTEISNPGARRIQRLVVLKEASKQMWDNTGRDMICNMLEEHGIELAALGIQVEDLYLMFEAGFRAAAGEFSAGDRSAGSGKPAILGPLEWQHGRRAEAVHVDLPPAPAGNICNYVLARDEERQTALYITTTSDEDFGLSWTYSGSAWQADNKLPLHVRGHRAQSFQGFYDPGRRGIACWSLIDQGDGSRAFGVLVTEGSADPIETRGDVPTGPPDCQFDIGLIFGFDRARRVTVALGREAIWELDATGSWRRAAKVPGDLAAMPQWFSDNERAVYDQAGARLIFIWTEWENVRYQLRSWDGHTLREVSTEGLPERPFNRFGGPFCAVGDRVVWLPGNHDAIYQLTGELTGKLADTRWQKLRATGGHAPLRSQGTRAVYLPDEDAFVLGPGRYTTRADDQRREHVFFTLAGGRWTRHGVAAVGTGSATDHRLLAATSQGVYALQASWRTLARGGDGGFVEVAAAQPMRPPPVALVGHGEALWAIAEGGAVYRMTGRAWTELAGPSIAFGDWRAPHVCYDPGGDRLVAWAGICGGKRQNQTLVFSGREWKLVANAGSPIASRSERRAGSPARPRSGVTYGLIYDQTLATATLFGKDEIAVFAGDRWAMSRLSSSARVDWRQRIFLHDDGAGETLLVDVKNRRIFRCDHAGYAPVADFAGAGEFVELKSPDVTRPFQADWVYDPGRRQLVLYVDDDLDEHYALDLGEVIDHARGKGPRQVPDRAAEIAGETATAIVVQAGQRLADSVPLDQLEEIIDVAADAASRAEATKLARKAWRHLAAGEIRAVCQERAIVGGEDRLTEASFRRPFTDAFIARFTSRLAEHVQGGSPALPFPPATWQVFGPRRPHQAVTPPPRAGRDEYVLTYDEAAGHIAYIGYHGRQFCQRWYWDGTAWRQAHVTPVAAGSLFQPFRGVCDPDRGGVVCWTVDSSHGRDAPTVVGVLVTSRDAHLLETRGDTPTLSETEKERDHQVLFAYDPERKVHLAITARGVWQLDQGNVWTRRVTWAPEANPLGATWDQPRIAGAAWDAAARRAVLWLASEGDHGDSQGDGGGERKRFRFFAVTGADIAEIASDGLPGEFYRSYRHCPVVGRAGERGICAYVAEAGLFALDASGWRAIDTGEGAPPRSREVQMAYDPDRKVLIFGPGDYATGPDGRRIRQQIFFARPDNQPWQLHGVLQPGGPTGGVTGGDRVRIEHVVTYHGRAIGATQSGDFYAWDDGVTWRAVKSADWTAWREMVVLMTNSRAGHPIAVTHMGGVHDLIDGTWRAREIDREAFGERICDCLVAHDPHRDRLLAWHHDAGIETVCDTLVLDPGGWRKIATDPHAGAVVPRELSDDGFGLARFDLLYDSFLDRFVRVGNADIAVLEGERWVVVTSLPAAAQSGPFRRVIHDPTSRETVIIDYRSRRITRFDVGQATVLTTYRWPEQFIDPDPDDRTHSFPFLHDSLYWPDTRQFTTYDQHDYYGNYRLDLGAIFDFAASLGPRTSLKPT